MAKNSPNASFSDIDWARRLSQRLRGGDASPDAAENRGYTRLRSALLGTQSSKRQSFDQILDSFLSTHGALAVLVMDNRGLLIAYRGALLEHEVEALGARLVFAVDQVSQMELEGNEPSSMAIRFESSWLSGYRVTLGEDAHVTVGIVGLSHTDAETQQELEEMLRQRAGVAQTDR